MSESEDTIDKQHASSARPREQYICRPATPAQSRRESADIPGREKQIIWRTSSRCKRLVVDSGRKTPLAAFASASEEIGHFPRGTLARKPSRIWGIEHDSINPSRDSRDIGTKQVANSKNRSGYKSLDHLSKENQRELTLDMVLATLDKGLLPPRFSQKIVDASKRVHAEQGRRP